MKNANIQVLTDVFTKKFFSPEVLTFSGGECHVKFSEFVYPETEQLRSYPEMGSTMSVIARIQNSEDMMQFLMADEIISRYCHHFDMRKKLFLPYMPYARQDRITENETAFSLKVFARIINSLNYRTVKCLDPHSDVTSALFNNFISISMKDIVERFYLGSLKLPGGIDIISPDAGAAKKVSEVAKFCARNLIVGSKTRNPATGKLSNFKISEEKVSEHCIIFDDICDGGGTFIELAKILRERGAKKVDLYVTHGIMSRGLGVFDGIIDHIYITDSLNNEITKNEKVTILPAVREFV